MINEYLELLGNKIRYKKEYVGNDIYRLYIKKNEIELLEKYLTELQAIKNSKPSEALEYLEYIGETCYVEAGNAEEDCTLYAKNYIGYDTIKNYILKAQEQGKALNELIKNHIEFVVEKDRCYFKIKNSKGNEKSFTSYTMLDFWKEVLKNE